MREGVKVAVEVFVVSAGRSEIAVDANLSSSVGLRGRVGANRSFIRVSLGSGSCFRVELHLVVVELMPLHYGAMCLRVF